MLGRRRYLMVPKKKKAQSGKKNKELLVGSDDRGNSTKSYKKAILEA